ncbi:MAG: hypothetical protein ACFLMY_05950 [Candidatus Brachytrichaceae bacterium NZ_4S206]|jgi:tetratricopeptide (TPR) repeat protein
MDAIAQDLIARLRRNPEDAAAFAALRAHYERIGDYASLANLLEGWAGRARDPAAAAQALYEAGELVLGALGDRDRAIALYERALVSEPRHRDAFLRLQGLFEEARELRKLADLLERQGTALARAGAPPRELALLYHQLGELWEHQFARPDQAVAHYRRAYELDPQLVPALYAAREILRQAGNVSGAAALLEKEAKAEPDRTRRVALWRELAHLRAELEDHEGAALALKRALAEAPGDLEVMHELARVYLARASRGHDPLVAASDRLRAADLLYQLGQKVAPEHALAYLDSALDARPDHEGALSLYERHADELGQRTRLPARWVAYLAHAPDRPEAQPRRRRLADAYLEAGQVEYAITCLEWLLDDGDAQAAGQLVDLYRSQGREEDAVRALGVAALGLGPEQRLPRLRELVATLRERGDAAGAARYAGEILALDAADPEALTVLEDAARRTGDYAPLRDALLGASRVSGLSVEGRKQRLREVAALSEQKLGDADGAIGAWRGVAALDPADREARAALKRLLTAAARWDELVDVLEREALSQTEPDAKAEVYRELAELHRQRRGDLKGAIVALRQLRELVPSDAPSRDLLCDLLLEAGATLEAIPLLRQRIDASHGPTRAELLRVLARVLEEDVGDEEGAFEAWARLLDESPTDLDALAHMEALDEAAGRHERLLTTLSYRVEVSASAERPGVLARMARIAETALGDLDRAAELYAQALELAPDDAGVLDALADVYARAERYRDLVVLLRQTAQSEADPRRRAELYRRIARTLAERVGNDVGAAEAFREVLAAGEDEEALRFLLRHAAREDDTAALDDLLRRLADVLGPSDEARDLAVERAELLATRLGRPLDAVLVLRHVVDVLAPDHLGALTRLAALCEQTGDRAGRIEALWRRLRRLDDPGLRLPLARQLADLHEPVPDEVDRAIEALFAWSQALPDDVTPLRRLVPLLERTGRARELVGVLDALAPLELEESEISSLVRWSAKLAHQSLGDVDGAWARLEPRVRAGDADAEHDLRELARAERLGERLAELYAALAQEPGTADPRGRWMDAARAYEEHVGDVARALEAVLRAFAIDLGELSYLAEADRLAERARAWPRLAQVYETLLRRAERPEEKVPLLVRHAALLDERARDVSGALDQTFRACALAPLDDAVLALAEDRAPRAKRADELLHAYERRKQRASDDAGRVEALLRAVRLCERALRDRAQATSYLAQAVALTVRTPALEAVLVEQARALDAEPGARGGLRKAVVDVLIALGDDMDADPVGGAGLLVRAARLLSSELSSDAEAFALLMRAAAMAPSASAVLDELEGFARPRGKLAEVDACFDRLVEEALDPRTAGALLRRRGKLLEELGQHAAAAEVWTRLSTVLAGDVEARERLRACLRATGRHQDLLVALERDLRRTSDAAERLALRKEVARVWERDLANRYEAIDAWKKVLKDAPDDAEAREALARLEAPRGARTEAAPPVRAEVSLPAPEVDAGDDYADLTDPSEEQSMSGDSSETMFDPGLYAELLGAQAALARAQANAPPAPAAVRDAETRRLTSAQASVEPPTRELPLRGERPAAEPPPAPAPPAPAPPPPPEARFVALGSPEDFDDEYTAVADDVFDAIQEKPAVVLDAPPQRDTFDEVATGEVRLPARSAREEEVAELDDADLLEDDGALADEVESLDAADAIEEVDDVEELEELEELESPFPSRTSRPPPPPGSAPPPRR